MSTPRPVPKCRSCDAQLRFVRMETGKAMPVSPEPDPDGVIAARWQDGRWIDGRILKRGDVAPAGWKRWRPHWADCPKSKVPLTKRAARVRPDTLF